MVFYLLQSLGSLFAFCHYKNNRVRYLAVITTLYFAGYFVDGSFDISLSIYFLMIFLGMSIPLKIDVSSILLGVWIIIYAAVGIVFQNAFTAIATLITRYGYILIFICMVSEKRTENLWCAKAEDYRFMVRLGLLTELAIIMLIWTRDGFGARIVTNHQPIGAGIVVGLSIIIGWCYIRKQFSAVETIWYSVFSVIITIVSGTRGYMVMIALTLMVIIVLFLLDIPENGQKMLIRIGICCLLASIIILWVFVLDRGQLLNSVLRLDEGLGYRENENVFVIELMRRAPWYNKMFGLGFGGDASRVKGVLEAAQKASWNRRYMFYTLQTRTIFHNYWYTVLFKQGIIGLVFIVLFYAMMIKRILRIDGRKYERWLLAALTAGSIISLTFRITATCSIFEMCLIAFFVRQLESGQKDAENYLGKRLRKVRIYK